MLSGRVVRFGYETVFDPGALVETSGPPSSGYFGGVGYWLGVYAVSLFLSAIPTAIQRVAFAPGDPSTWGRFVWFVMQDFWPVLIIGLLTVGLYHALLVLSFNSDGLYTTLVTFVQGTGVYLATALGVYLLQPWAGTEAELVFLEGENVLAVPAFDPAAGVVPNLGLVVLFASLLYYAYSLYLSARINGDAGLVTSAAISVLSTVFVFRLYYELFQLLGQVSIIGLYAPF